MVHRLIPAPFLTKTYELVDDGVTDEVISWSESGNTLVVWKHAEFANDFLPKYFKHNNFSSFVRQLNTYGFRKIVSDKWEFENENFKRGQKPLLSLIKRRKTSLSQSSAQTPVTGKFDTDENFPANSSANDNCSISTSSLDSKNRRPMVVTDLSSENQKLKKDNETLRLELAHVNKRCDELVIFLRDCLKVGPTQMNGIVGQVSCGSMHFDDDNDDNIVGGGDSLKLFGVWLKEESVKERNNYKHKRRERQDQMDLSVDFSGAMPMMKSSKVCN